MTRLATFALVREGSSDDALIPHLSELLIRAGLDEALGAPREYKGSVTHCLLKVQEEESPVDVIFVHRDSDRPSSEGRRSEIADAVAALGSNLATPVVPVVPIQELEAWLLLDEAAIRAVAGKPSSKGSLNLPKRSHIETTASPKEILQEALLSASETTGRRHKEAKRRFSEHRRTLLARLDLDGPIRELSAWQALERDVEAAASQVLSR